MISRRNFLALGAGAFAAKAFGGDYTFYETGIADEQVLKVTPIEIDLGLGKAFKALHFSDTHLNFFDVVDAGAAAEKNAREKFYQRWVRFPQAVQSFYATLDYARRNALPMFHTGDLIDISTAGNDRFLAHNVAGLDWHCALGNHEYQIEAPGNYTTDEPAQRRRLQPHFRNDLTVASRVIGGANFVAIDNARVNLREETIFRARAEFDKGLPVVPMCHIPPFYTAKFLDNSVRGRAAILRKAGKGDEDIRKLRRPANVWDSYDQKTRDFWTWTQTNSRLKAILCGHTHCEEIDGFSETASMYVAGGNFEGRAYEITFL